MGSPLGGMPLCRLASLSKHLTAGRPDRLGDNLPSRALLAHPIHWHDP